MSGFSAVPPGAPGSAAALAQVQAAAATTTAAAAAGGVAGSGKTLTPDQLARSRKSAEAFEAMALGQLLQPMFKTLDTSKGLFGGGQAEAMWQPMLVDEMAKLLAKRGGIGIADAVYKEMLRIQEAKNAKDDQG